MTKFLSRSYIFHFTMLIFFIAFTEVNGTDLNYRQFQRSGKVRISAGAAFKRAVRSGQIRITSTNAPTEIAKNQAITGVPQIDGPVTESINYDEDKTLNGYAQTPPDNHGAAGPDHFILVVNTAIQWYTKTDRTLEYSSGLNDFFAPTEPSDLFDPRVVYDQYAQRFVVIADEEDDASKINFIHLAVSRTSNPNDGWYFQRINTKTNINGTDTWLDFPALAISNQAIYLTGNMFSFSSVFQASRLWILDKGLYNGVDTSTVNIYDPSTEAGLSDQAFTLIPAQMYGDAPGALGTFLFTSEWDDNNGNDDLIGIFRVDDPLGSSGGPVFSVQFLNPGEIHNNSLGVPTAPQKDTDINIDFGDDRAQTCVWRNNVLVGAYTINPSNGDQAGQATNFWFTVNTTDLDALTLSQQGYIAADDIADSTYTGYPAVAINDSGDIAIGFAASAKGIYAGSYFTVHGHTDPAGEVQPSQTMHEGVDYYVRTGLPFHIGNRWGDYSAMSLDPTDEYSFWVFNQYAWTRGDYDAFADEDGRWATSFAKINPNSGPSAIGPLAGKHQPVNFVLNQNYPNPFGEKASASRGNSTFIEYAINNQHATPVPVTISVYNTLGQKVRTLVNTNQTAGNYRVRFNAGNLPSGVYFYHMKAGDFEQIRKMILIR